jgi:predicted dinucleotide-binding enzyme
MKYAVLGTGEVGRTIAAKLAEQGHQVRLGSRSAGEGKHPYAEAAAWAEIVVNATKGMASLEALRAAGATNLAGKILIDIANPLDFSRGMPPNLSVKDDDSLGEQIQREFPAARVVKTLNTMSCHVMVNPGLINGPHDVFMSGNDPVAKQAVRELLLAWGWREIIDLGDIGTARGTEMLLPIWIRLMVALGHSEFNFHIAGKARPAPKGRSEWP